jgi:glycerol-3-phosphate dehydrogenase (NAD(P)+)
VVEGAATTVEMIHLARLLEVEMPITEQVGKVLHQGEDPRRAMEILLARDPKPERF